ncbi:hypothetical protein JW977_03885 [Candidatus Falkowbacteria bacterium]|nr:hypothetical protein [Candidatus Falkowbacteria bacterium]
MKTNRPIEGIFTLPNGDVFVDGWVPALIPQEAFGGVELVPVSELSSPYLGTNGDDKWHIFSPHNLLNLSNAPSDDDLARAEKLSRPTIH